MDGVFAEPQRRGPAARDQKGGAGAGCCCCCPSHASHVRSLPCAVHAAGMVACPAAMLSALTHPTCTPTLTGHVCAARVVPESQTRRGGGVAMHAAGMPPISQLLTAVQFVICPPAGLMAPRRIMPVDTSCPIYPALAGHLLDGRCRAFPAPQLPPYELTEVGWGEFDIIVTVHFRVSCCCRRCRCCYCRACCRWQCCMRALAGAH